MAEVAITTEAVVEAEEVTITTEVGVGETKTPTEVDVGNKITTMEEEAVEEAEILILVYVLPFCDPPKY